jgi:hypothetical protein
LVAIAAAAPALQSVLRGRLSKCWGLIRRRIKGLKNKLHGKIKFGADIPLLMEKTNHLQAGLPIDEFLSVNPSKSMVLKDKKNC